jgi:hypothetical protein
MGDDEKEEADPRLVEDQLILERPGRTERRIGWNFMGCGAVFIIGSAIVSFMGLWGGAGGFGAGLASILLGVWKLREAAKTLAIARRPVEAADRRPADGD